MSHVSRWPEWLRAQLEERGWNQTDLKNRSGVNDSQISRWLAGKNHPGLAKIRAVCQALGVPPVEGMIAAGHLLPEDVVGTAVVIRPRTTGPGDLSDSELLAELARRLGKQA